MSVRFVTLAGVGMLAAVALAAPHAGAPLRVCATTSDLASLVVAVGGADVQVTVLAVATNRPQTPLAQAQLLVSNGLGLEREWLPGLLQSVDNAGVLPGARGNLDASRFVHPLENPHYLLDPVNGLLVAAGIRAKLEELRPAARQRLTEAYEAFRARLGVAMLGDRLGSKYPIDKIAELFALGTLDTFLAAQHESDLLGGWFRALRGHRGARVVADQDVWPYFARRFGIEVVGVLDAGAGAEARRRLVETMRERDVRLVLATGGRAAAVRALASQARAVVVPMAARTGARPGTDDYLAMIGYDVEGLAGALRKLGTGSSPGRPQAKP